jgi:hypothetical protein
MMNFARNEDADTNGTSLREYCDDLTDSKVRALLGKPDCGGFYDPDNGYDGMEYKFVSDQGHVVNLYSRFEAYRIGAHDDGVAILFKEWLSNK